jgi:TolA-binding protein
MNRLQKALGVLTVAVFGAWGCAQGTSGPSASSERIKTLEAKSSRLEEDFRAASAARDQLRKKLTAAEEDQAKLKQENEVLLAASKERDELKAQFKTFTGERDVLVGEIGKIQKSLQSVQDVMGHYTAALNAGNPTTLVGNPEIVPTPDPEPMPVPSVTATPVSVPVPATATVCPVSPTGQPAEGPAL